MAAAALFSADSRASETPKGHTESEYAFLDRSAHEQVARVRELLDALYARLPVAARASIRNRFASNDLGVHRGALLELYLHEMFHRLELEVDVDVGRENAGRRRPDFLIGSARQAFYVEATAAVGASVLGGTSQGVAAAMRECIERVRAPSFFLGEFLGGIPHEHWVFGSFASAPLHPLNRRKSRPVTADIGTTAN